MVDKSDFFILSPFGSSNEESTKENSHSKYSSNLSIISRSIKFLVHDTLSST